MATIMDERVRSPLEHDLSDVRKCRTHGLFFDGDITKVCPLCERERVDRIAGTV